MNQMQKQSQEPGTPAPKPASKAVLGLIFGGSVGMTFGISIGVMFPPTGLVWGISIGLPVGTLLGLGLGALLDAMDKRGGSDEGEGGEP